MSLSMRKINAIFKLKMKSVFTNMSIMIAPLMAVGYVLVMKLVMPNNTWRGAYLLGFGILFNVIMGGIMMGSYPLAEEKENTQRQERTAGLQRAFRAQRINEKLSFLQAPVGNNTH